MLASPACFRPRGFDPSISGRPHSTISDAPPVVSSFQASSCAPERRPRAYGLLAAEPHDGQRRRRVGLSGRALRGSRSVGVRDDRQTVGLGERPACRSFAEPSRPRGLYRIRDISAPTRTSPFAALSQRRDPYEVNHDGRSRRRRAVYGGPFGISAGRVTVGEPHAYPAVTRRPLVRAPVLSGRVFLPRRVRFNRRRPREPRTRSGRGARRNPAESRPPLDTGSIDTTSRVRLFGRKRPTADGTRARKHRSQPADESKRFTSRLLDGRVPTYFRGSVSES